MENGDRPAGPVFYFVALSVLALDQITKYVIRESMFRGQSIDVLGSFFSLTYVQNNGAAFGLELGGRWSFIAVTILVAAFILFYYARSERTRTARWALALILGGALGNLVDRVWIGAVVDFLHFSLGSFSYPIFNVADIGVSVGVGLLAIHLFRKDHSEGEDHDGEPRPRTDPAGEESGAA